MTEQEFSREFDVLYDSLSNGSPEINSYEKSIFLTRAQEEIVLEYYDKGFESDERTRTVLHAITAPYSTTSNRTILISGAKGLSPFSKFFPLPLDCWLIVQEDGRLSNPGECNDGEYISIKPVTHDEYNITKKNPFRKQNNRRALRVDVHDSGATRYVEIICNPTILEYRNRYIKKPTPIVVSGFTIDPDLKDLALTVDGANSLSGCKLNSIVHREILTRAVQLAILAYRENSLGNNVQVYNK